MARIAPRILTFLLGLAPAVYIGWQAWLAVSGHPNDLGPDPGKAIEHFNGQWALRFLLITLTISPLRQIAGWTEIVRLRRMLGLFTFFYATMHLMSYLVFMLGLRLDELIHDIAKKPYILVGFAAYCGLLPLAATSNRWMMKRLKQRWKKLHRMIYGIAILAIIHLFWLTRSSYFEVFVYASVVAVLLGYRICRSSAVRRLLRGDKESSADRPIRTSAASTRERRPAYPC